MKVFTIKHRTLTLLVISALLLSAFKLGHKQQKWVLDKVLFPPNSPVLVPTESSEKQLDSMANLIKQLADKKQKGFILRGNSDIGVDQGISLARALSVKKALLERGVNEPILCIGLGISQRASTRRGDPKNRRIELETTDAQLSYSDEKIYLDKGKLMINSGFKHFDACTFGYEAAQTQAQLLLRNAKGKITNSIQLPTASGKHLIKGIEESNKLTFYADGAVLGTFNITETDELLLETSKGQLAINYVLVVGKP